MPTSITMIRPLAQVLTTSNITGAIDLAFVDRADIKAFIGPPSAAARYEMLRGCVAEMARVGIVRAPPLLPWRQLQTREASKNVSGISQQSVGSKARVSKCRACTR